MKHLILLALLAAGCASTQDWTKMSPQERQEAVHAVADDCKIGRKSFQLRDHELLMVPALMDVSPTAQAEPVDCALRKLKRIGAWQSLSFIGNAASPVGKN